MSSKFFDSGTLDEGESKVPKFTLRKLPLSWYRNQVDEEVKIDFEWPTQDMIKDLPENVFLNQIQFMAH